MSVNKSKLNEFKKRHQLRHSNSKTNYLRTQLETQQTESSDNYKDVLDILNINPLGKAKARDAMLKTYGLSPDNNELSNRKKNSIALHHITRMNEISSI